MSDLLDLSATFQQLIAFAIGGLVGSVGLLVCDVERHVQQHSSSSMAGTVRDLEILWDDAHVEDCLGG